MILQASLKLTLNFCLSPSNKNVYQVVLKKSHTLVIPLQTVLVSKVVSFVGLIKHLSYSLLFIGRKQILVFHLEISPPPVFSIQS